MNLNIKLSAQEGPQPPNTTKAASYYKQEPTASGEMPRRQNTKSANRQTWGQRKSTSPTPKMPGAYNNVLETEGDLSVPNIFNLKNQVIHEASYNEEYTARESTIKKAVNSDEKYDFDDVDEDPNNSNMNEY